VHRWEKILTKINEIMHASFVLHGDGFAISYNPSCRAGDANFYHGFDDKETAIVKDDEYFILNGDHRKEYEALISKGFEACKKYYDSHQDQRSMWSSDNDFFKIDIDELDKKKKKN
jgi:hypothetical protein